MTWKSFYYFYNKRYPEADFEAFRDLTTPVALQVSMLTGGAMFYGYYENNELLGVVGIRQGRILFLFVERLHWYFHIGTKLVKHAIARAQTNTITVEAYLPVVGFYKKLGFEVCGREFDEYGVPAVPMKLELE